MRYFRRVWDEPRDDEFCAWGPATYWFEACENGDVQRQLEVYSSGDVLAYDTAHVEDDYGGLTDRALDLLEFAPYEVSRDEFERAWCPAMARNRAALRRGDA